MSRRAPASLAVHRCHERVVLVLAYVAQLSASREVEVASRSSMLFHKVSRIPPKCMSCDLLKHLGVFSVVAPICVEEFLLA